MKAVVLAGGEGARMGPFTASEPKVMIPVGNRPILEHVVRALVGEGIPDIVLVVGYRRERIQSYFQDGNALGARIDYAVEGKQLGTAHALLEARAKVHGPFLVLNGSNLLDRQAISDLVGGGPGPSVLIAESDNPSKYGVVLLSENRVQQIVEKPREPIGNMINTGAYLLDDSVFPVIESLAKQGMHDLPSAVVALSSVKPVAAIRTRGVWSDALYPWDLLKLNAEVLKGIPESKAGTIEKGVTIRGKVLIGDGSVLRAGTYIQGPVVIGEGCEVGPYAVLLAATSLGKNVHVGPFSLVDNSILMDDADVGPGCILQDTVAAAGVKLRAAVIAARGKASAQIEGEWHAVESVGGLIGEDAEIESGVVIESGAIIGTRARAAANARLRGAIPNGGIVV
jgi:UDP-N-acetylglucosamine diphosphorylase/glucosamine-1-phosphate N-acetyltransferase